MIKTIVKKHPLRDIVLDFDDTIEPPEFERRALSMYYEAHDKTWDLQRHAAEQLAKINSGSEKVDDLLLRKLGIEQELHFLEESLGIKEYDEDIVIDEEITIDVTGLFERTQKHHDDLNEVYSLVDGLTKEYNEDIDNIFEDDYLIDPKYFDVLYELYQRYDEVSVHTVSLDDDHQTFLGAYQKVEKTFFDYLDMAGQLFDRYADLVYGSDDLYRRVNAVYERINDKMRDMGR